MSKLIVSAYPDLDGTTSVYGLARHLAQNAKILERTEGLSPQKAQDEAIRRAGPSYFKDAKKPRNAPGSSPQAPLAIPNNATPNDLKNGYYYQTPKDGVQVWDAASQTFHAANQEALAALEDDELPILPDEVDEEPARE